MSTQVANGRLSTIAGDSSNIVVSGLPFKPKFIILWSCIDGSPFFMGGLGIGISSSVRGWSGFHIRDNVATSVTKKSASSSLIMGWIDQTVFDGQLDLVSLSSDGFTLSVGDVTPNINDVEWVAFGGSDITDVSLDVFTPPALASTDTVVTSGIEADAIILWSTDATDVSETIAANPIMSFGVCDRSLNQGAIGSWSEDAQGFSNCGRAISGTFVINKYFQDAVYERGQISVISSTGFTVDWDTVTGGTTIRHFALSIKGGNWQVGTDTTRTSIGTKATTTTHKSKGLLILAGNTPSLDTHDSGGGVAIGFASVAGAANSQGIVEEDNLDTADGSRSASITDVIRTKNDSSPFDVNDSAAVDSFNDNDFTLDYLTADATARQFVWLAVSDAIPSLVKAAQITEASNQQLTIVDDATYDLPATGDRSGTFWGYFDSLGGLPTQDMVLMGNSNDAGAIEYKIVYCGPPTGPDNFNFDVRGTTNLIAVISNAALDPEIGRWHFFYWSYSSDGADVTIVFRIDDTHEATDTQTSTRTLIASSKYRLGGLATPSPSEDHHDGRMSGEGFYGRLLTAEEQTEIFNLKCGSSYAQLPDSVKADTISYRNLNELTGTRFDSHTGNLNLTDVNGVSSATGPAFSSPVRFNSANSEFGEVDSAAITSLGCSLCALVYIDTHQDQSILWIGDKDVDDDYLMIGMNASGNAIMEIRSVGETAQQRVSTTVLLLRTWNLIMAVFVSPTLRILYVNGVFEAIHTTSRDITNPDRTSLARRGGSTPSGYLSAIVAKAQVFDLALNANQVFALAQMNIPVDADPVSDWKLNEGNGSTLSDDGSNGFDLSMLTSPGIWTITHLKAYIKRLYLVSRDMFNAVSAKSADAFKYLYKRKPGGSLVRWSFSDNYKLTDGNILLFDALSGDLTVPAASEFNDTFDSGSTIAFDIFVKSAGEGGAGIAINKLSGSSGWSANITNADTVKCALEFRQEHTVTPGIWETPARIYFGQWYRIFVVYANDNVANDPTIYIEAHDLGVTETSTPVGTRVSDSAEDLIFGNRAADDRTLDGVVKNARIWKGESLSSATIRADVKSNTIPAETLDGAWKINEGSGLTVFDSSGNDNDGTITTTGWDTDCDYAARQAVFKNKNGDRVGRSGAAEFDGIDGIMEVSTADFRPSDLGGTILARLWVDPTANATHAVFSTADEGSSNRHMGCRVMVTGGNVVAELVWQDGGGQTQMESTAHVPRAMWVTIAYSSDGGSYRIDINYDETLLTEITGSDLGNWTGDISTPFRDNVTIGGRRDAGGVDNQFHGRIDRVWYYDTQISVDDQFDVVELGKENNSSALKHYWKFDNNGLDEIGSLDMTSAGGVKLAANAAFHDSVGDIEDAVNVPSLRGVDDVISLDSIISDINTLENGSFEISYKLRLNPSTDQTIIAMSRTTDAVNTGLFVEHSSADNSINVQLLLDGVIQWACDTPADSAIKGTMDWLHLGISMDDTEVSITIDGVDQDLTFTTSLDRTKWWKAIFTDATSPAEVVNLGASETFSGIVNPAYIQFANAAFWSDERLRAEFESAMADGFIVTGSAGLISYYPIDDEVATVTDIKGGNDGTLEGGIWIKDPSRPIGITPSEVEIDITSLSYTSGEFYYKAGVEGATKSVPTIAPIVLDYVDVGFTEV